MYWMFMCKCIGEQNGTFLYTYCTALCYRQMICHLLADSLVCGCFNVIVLLFIFILVFGSNDCKIRFIHTHTYECSEIQKKKVCWKKKHDWFGYYNKDSTWYMNKLLVKKLVFDVARFSAMFTFIAKQQQNNETKERKRILKIFMLSISYFTPSLYDVLLRFCWVFFSLASTYFDFF